MLLIFLLANQFPLLFHFGISLRLGISNILGKVNLRRFQAILRPFVPFNIIYAVPSLVKQGKKVFHIQRKPYFSVKIRSFRTVIPYFVLFFWNIIPFVINFGEYAVKRLGKNHGQVLHSMWKTLWKRWINALFLAIPVSTLTGFDKWLLIVYPFLTLPLFKMEEFYNFLTGRF